MSVEADPTKEPQKAKRTEKVTRREWLLSLGGSIVLAGTAGVPRDAKLGLKQAARVSAGEPATKLPPGLYGASLDHLTHVLERDNYFIPIPAGSETDYVRPQKGPFHPQFFSPGEFEIIRCLVEIILGEDLRSSEQKTPPGAPGSIYDEIAEWIDLIAGSAPSVRKLAMDLPSEQRALAVAYFGSEEPVRELETFEPDRILMEGLAWLATTSARLFGKDFNRLTQIEQLHIVSSISDGRTQKLEVNAGIRLFDLVKRESIRGFYTSRLGLGELDILADSFHPESPGCSITPIL